MKTKKVISPVNENALYENLDGHRRARSEPLGEASVELLRGAQGSNLTYWVVKVDGRPVGRVEKFRDTRTETNPYKVFRYTDFPNSKMIGVVYTPKGKEGLLVALKAAETGTVPPGSDKYEAKLSERTIDQEKLDKFMAVYSKHLANVAREKPEEYGLSPEQVPAVAAKMRAAMERGSYNHNSLAYARACKELGIPYARKNIEAYILKESKEARVREVKADTDDIWATKLAALFGQKMGHKPGTMWGPGVARQIQADLKAGDSREQVKKNWTFRLFGTYDLDKAESKVREGSDRPPKYSGEGAWKMTMAQWKGIHRDYKGNRDGKRSALTLDPKTGATISVPVEIVAAVESKVNEGDVIQFPGLKKAAPPAEKPAGKKWPSKEELRQRYPLLGKVLRVKGGTRRYVVISVHAYGQDLEIANYTLSALSGGDAGSQPSNDGPHNIMQHFEVDPDQKIVFSGANRKRREADYRRVESPDEYPPRDEEHPGVVLYAKKAPYTLSDVVPPVVKTGAPRQTNTVNRGWLLKKALAGQLLGRTSYAFDDMYGQVKASKEWLPVTILQHGTPHQEPDYEKNLVLWATDFQGSTGSASIDPKNPTSGIIALHIHQNHSVEFKLKGHETPKAESTMREAESFKVGDRIRIDPDWLSRNYALGDTEITGRVVHVNNSGQVTRLQLDEPPGEPSAFMTTSLKSMSTEVPDRYLKRESTIRETDIPTQHQIKIAKKTLQMNDVFANIMGGPSKEDARKILKANGYSDAQIAKIEAGKGESTVREDDLDAEWGMNPLTGHQILKGESPANIAKVWDTLPPYAQAEALVAVGILQSGATKGPKSMSNFRPSGWRQLSPVRQNALVIGWKRVVAALRASPMTKKYVEPVTEASTGKFKIYIDGRYRYFDSLDAAKKAAQEIFDKTGNIVGIEAASGGKVAEASEVAQTILSQIPSGVRMSLGARDFVGDKDRLMFRVGGGGLKKVVIILDPSDTYTVQGWRGKAATFKMVKEYTDVYVEDLPELLIKLNSLLHGFGEAKAKKVFEADEGPKADDPPKIAALRKIVRDKQYGKVDGQKVDLFSASAVIAVWDGLNAANKAKFLPLPVARMASIAFKFVK